MEIELKVRVVVNTEEAKRQTDERGMTPVTRREWATVLEDEILENLTKFGKAGSPVNVFDVKVMAL